MKSFILHLTWCTFYYIFFAINETLVSIVLIKIAVFVVVVVVVVVVVIGQKSTLQMSQDDHFYTKLRAWSNYLDHKYQAVKNSTRNGGKIASKCAEIIENLINYAVSSIRAQRYYLPSYTEMMFPMHVKVKFCF